jgi:uncharacterized protein (TIGR02001 family)
MKHRMLSPLACLALAPAAFAGAPTWSGSVAVASDNLLRGVSRSSNDPALSGELRAQWGRGAFVSIWSSTSRVRPADDTTVELAATAGMMAPLRGDWAIRGSYTHYESPWQNRADFYRYDEFTVDLRYRDTLFLTASYSPNTSRYASSYGPAWDGDTFAYEASLQRELRTNLRAHAGVGYYDLSNLFGEGYWYGSIGLGWSWRRLQADLSWVDTDETAERLSYAGAAGGRWLFMLGINF